LEDKSRNWDLELLNTIISESKNKDLHYQEQALLIGFINNRCKQVRKITQEADDHRYITCYLDNVRPVVGIDEATDFSIVEIYAMASFALPEFSSITLDGDLMQRLTNKGIRQWNDLENVLPNYQVLPLTLSFRQSVKMLNLARMLYKDSVGHDPVYSAKKDANTVPNPLAFINADEQEKLNWIEKRIAEIYDIYCSLPSTAIFLNDHEQEFKFAQDLGARKFFKTTGIKVVVGNEGENLAKENLVRVFSIEKVKGMEFDAVFFHNIDDTPYSGDLIKRFIYVGVSRAAFFLGITMSKKNKDNEGLLKYFDTKANWKYFE
jgi:DNA helicase IV